MGRIISGNKNNNFLFDYVTKVNTRRIKVLFAFSLITFWIIIGLFILSNLPKLPSPPPIHYPLMRPTNIYTYDPVWAVILSSWVFVFLYCVCSLFTLGYGLSLINYGSIYLLPLKIVAVIPVASGLCWTIIIHFKIAKLLNYKIKDSDTKTWSLLSANWVKNAGIIDGIAFWLPPIGLGIELIMYQWWPNQEIFFFMDFAVVSWLMLSWLYFYVILTIRAFKHLNYPHYRLVAFFLIVCSFLTYFCLKGKLKQMNLKNGEK